MKSFHMKILIAAQLINAILHTQPPETDWVTSKKTSTHFFIVPFIQLTAFSVETNWHTLRKQVAELLSSSHNFYSLIQFVYKFSVQQIAF